MVDEATPSSWLNAINNPLFTFDKQDDKMRGNWEEASTSDHQQQQGIVKKQEPHHLPTTPAWSSVDKIVVTNRFNPSPIESLRLF
ncbi:hypothetical protein K0M31_004672 [Melipona bicolor]|uniref:Uncharacterized protein n=1 Tax=Melipona bicolor TaxID=60889 RepID=A0AA40FX97_9HYME|nr:hypothetical protein K0M31_004672 [Melipona bicolor]